MQIAFIAIMNGSAWGGSEYLWAEAAQEALTAGHTVLISVFEWTAKHAQVQALIQKGAILHTRNNYFSTSPTNEIKKILHKNALLPNPYQQITAFSPHIICISQGGSSSIMYDLPLQRWLSQQKTPYFLISQFNQEVGTLPFERVEPLKKVIFSAKKMFFVAKRNQEVLERQIGQVISHGEVICNPINLTDRNVLPFPKSETALWASVARLDCNYKGQDILLQTLSSDKWRNRAWKLHLYGEGVHYKLLEKLIQSFKLTEKVTLKGHASNIHPIWAAHHLLILSSIAEGTPLAMVEAMLCGRAVVATDVGDCGVYVEEGKTGFLAETASVKYLDAALERAWVSREKWEIMGNNAAQKANVLADAHAGKTLLNRMFA
jgi:glycosyltransferase involved in cell wall biosynthesis